MKAQVSTEYLIVVSFALLLTIPTIVIFFSQSTDNIEQVNNQQAKQIARKIIDSAESVYYLGKPSATTLKVVMPGGIQKIDITNRMIVITIDERAGPTDIIEVSSVNLTGSLSPSSGVMHIRVENIGDMVNISYR
ncbi:hypothetical protein HYY72_03280 [Candidatus Woesearchaeota archaeon]|nr:hypothetical protein [Candidatus Woesearchaeota archaeon]